MKKFRCLRPFALLLSLLMLIYAFPFSTTALTTTDASDIAAEPTNDIGASLSDIIDTEAISGVREVTDLREENVKHFALPDGTYTAITYANPVHRKDENGIWQDIDNTLSMKAVKNKERYATSDMRVSFSKAFSEGEALFALTENGYTIQMAPFSWGSNTGTSVMALTPSENKTVTVSNTEKRVETQRFDTIEEAAAVNNKSSIVYENVKTNTDLEYVLDGNDVKENIIVKSAGGSYVYRFTLSLTGLSAALLPSGDISLTDSVTGAQKYTIPAPYMYDANGTLSHDVHYTLTPAGSGSYTLTVTASPEWINVEDRAFPVVIDPTVTKNNQFFDTYIYSTAPNASYDSITLLPVYDETIVYFKWALPTLPDGSVITSANLHVMPINLEWGPIWIGAYRMLQDWLSFPLTWNSASSNLTNFGMAATPLSATYISTGAVYTTIDITDAAKEWYVDRSTNQGVALKKLDGDSNHVLLYSSEADSGKKAYFSVTYQSIEDGIYYVKNAKTKKYMDLEGSSYASGTPIQQWSFHSGNQAKWVITHESDNYFSIKSLYSNLYVGIDQTDPYLIAQYSAVSNLTLWRFDVTSSGNHAIICKGAEGPYNSIASESASPSNGENLTALAFIDDAYYQDEWILHRIEEESSIAPEGQLKSNWCWAATSRMFAKHFYNAITYTQTQAVQHVKNTTSDVTGTLEEAQSAMNYYISNISQANINTAIKEHLIYSEETLIRFLDDGYVLYISRGNYSNINNPNSFISGHALLICGYVKVNGEYRFLIRNSSPVNQGSSDMMSYDKICNGYNAQEDETPDQGVWRGSIVINTSYDDSTIPYFFDQD